MQKMAHQETKDQALQQEIAQFPLFAADHPIIA